MADDQFTLHRRAWSLFRRLPRILRVWIVLAVIGILVKLVLLSGSSDEQGVRAAVVAAVREATGPDPASSCSALSAVGLSQVLNQFGAQAGVPLGGDQLAECQQVVVRLRSEATPQQLADFADGAVQTVEFRTDGSALVIYLASDHRLGAQLTISRESGRWLIDSVDAGAIAAAG